MVIVANSYSDYHAVLQPSVCRSLLVVCVGIALISSLMSCKTNARNILRPVGDCEAANGLIESNSWNLLEENCQFVLQSCFGGE